MRYLTLTLTLALLPMAPSSLGQAHAQSVNQKPEDHLLRQAKGLRYAARWYEAQQIYRQFIREYPQSPRISDARYWLASSLESDQRWDEAAKAYTEFLLNHPDQRLYGTESKLNRIRCWGIRLGQSPEAEPGLVNALQDESTEVRVAAALQLAKRRDSRSISALQAGLKLDQYADACRLALASMGIQPKASVENLSNRYLHLRIKDKNKGEPVSVRIALSLAKAVLGYLSEDQLKLARNKGFEPDRIMDLANNAQKGTILLQVEDRDSSITLTVE